MLIVSQRSQASSCRIKPQLYHIIIWCQSRLDFMCATSSCAAQLLSSGAIRRDAVHSATIAMPFRDKWWMCCLITGSRKQRCLDSAYMPLDGWRSKFWNGR